jgi:site-specific recombinase XerD
MFVLKSQGQGLITLSQQDYLPILVDSFLIDRRSQGLSPESIELYTKKLQYFLKYCERQALTKVSQITSDFIRRYLLELAETHNPGGVHACFRLSRTFLLWIEGAQRQTL